MSGPRIAVVGIALRYPDASTPDELWRNVLAGRRAFRRLPAERMRAEDYYSPDADAPDRHCASQAAVLEGFEFDRVGYRISGSTFRSTDLTHWLALDTVARALADAGFPGGDGLPRTATGVIIGNTLTGEFSRANQLRLRWPYVQRTVGAALREQGWNDRELGSFLERLEERYKAPFPAADEDTLAGGLASTIAGRICNYFDFGGGGFTVDGACSSSLLSVATACNALAAGQLAAAVVGGVDLSIDPFEMTGFTKAGALASVEMKVYDRAGNGFWPGEGCGIVVLMREQEAAERGLFRYATIAGWGYSSDGRGSITRPEAAGHRRAIDQAYAAAGFGFDTVGYIEGHGTGTAAGDAAELAAFTEARRAAGPDAPPVAIGTVKGNIGHTKAAAGVAGLIKAVLAVRHQVIPPATSHHEPHPALTGARPALRVPATAELWPEGVPVRAGVSSVGFGGINAHVVVEHADGVRRTGVGRVTQRLVRSRQDAELLLLDAVGLAELRGRAAQLAALSGRLSFAELGDLAGTLAGALAGRPIRAAIVASSPAEAEQRFGKLLSLLDGGVRSVLDPAGGVFLGAGAAQPCIGFLFPGQGAGPSGDGGALRRRFSAADELYQGVQLPAGDPAGVAVTQPRIVTASVAGLRVLSALGIEAVTAAGHSLGELTALYWAGTMSEALLLRTATARGEIMARSGCGGGAMASIAAPPGVVSSLLSDEPVVIAGYNSPRQTVISGPADAVDWVCTVARGRGLDTARLPVSHAFHSKAVAPASVAFRTYLERQRFTSLTQAMVSTVSGTALPAVTNVSELLSRQILDPVRFSDAVETMSAEVDLFIEVGPGRVLRGLATECAPAVPAVSIEAGSPSLAGLLGAAGAAWALGAPVRLDVLFTGRYLRPFPLDKEFSFLASPCEAAPEESFTFGEPDPQAPPAEETGPAAVSFASGGRDGAGTPPDSLEVLRRLAAARAELPLEAVRPDSNPVGELHMSSITVAQILGQAARELGLQTVVATSAVGPSTLAELAQMLDDLRETAHAAEPETDVVAGAGTWVRAFSVDQVPATRGPAGGPAGDGEWQLFATEDHPLAQPLLTGLRQAGVGGGVLLCLPAEAGEEHVPLLLAAARAALAARTGPARFVTVGGRKGAAGLAKTLHLEAPGVAVTVVVLAEPEEPDGGAIADAVTWITADVAATSSFAEVHYDRNGARTVPVLRPVPRPVPRTGAAVGGNPLGPGDVLLVTGGGQGITAECALALGQGTGAAVAILGRSDPAADAGLRANLDRLRQASVPYHYVQADVTSALEVQAAVAGIRQVLGPPTGVLHGAGRNEPLALASLDEDSFYATLEPKTGGLATVLAAVDPGSLKLLVTFGSIVGRAGLPGEADYATANDWLTALTQQAHERHPSCRCLALEWSVWAGAGMGERLGVLEALIREGVTPIPVEQGVAILTELLADPGSPDAVVVMGRAEGLPTLTLERGELPLTRFTERPRVWYPGIELVVDVDLSTASDPYLTDHQFGGGPLFPAVLGLEAMVQAGAALTGQAGLPTLTGVEFLRPIPVPADGEAVIRIAALAGPRGTVQVVIRAASTGFQADHMRATLSWASREIADRVLEPATGDGPRVPVDPATDLYGPVLFQNGRFRRLRGYRRLRATQCVAEVAGPSGAAWFGDLLPGSLLLADPGTRDACLHAIQCCVPDATLLPVGADWLRLAGPAELDEADQLTVYACERSHDGDTYVYDLDIAAPDGRIAEQWRGLRLQAAAQRDAAGPWLPALLGPYLERHAEPTLGWLHAVVHPDGGTEPVSVPTRRGRTAAAVSGAIGQPATVAYRPDGRPLVEGMQVTASHGAGVTFALVDAARRVGCDVEPAVRRPDREWAGLLGRDGLALARLLSTGRAEDLSVSATRVWGAVEALRKAGHTQLALADASGPDQGRWVTLRSGGARIASFVTNVHGVPEPVVFTLLVDADAP